jgi:undecaprenyl-phosphate 4-deoxy-4-formamido-L-arabinose transferase
MRLSVIIPVYRGKEILRGLFRRISEILAGNYDYEVLAICDGCDDESLRVINELKKNSSSQIKVFRLAHNYGQHRAIQFGFGKASGDLIITIDEDLQHDPADIPRLIEKQKEGNYDVVYGRFPNLHHLAVRNKISQILRKVLKHFILPLYDNYSSYRLIKKEIASQVTTMVSPYTFIDDFLSGITQKIAYVDITHHQRPEGHSSYTFNKLIKHGIYILLAYSGIITWMLVLAVIMLLIGVILFILNEYNDGRFFSGLLSNRFAVGTFGIGLLLMIMSYFGTYINQRNIKRNRAPVIFLNENSL